MAKVIDSQFLIIEGKGEEFMQIGFGAASVQDLGVIKGGVFDGFGMVNIEGGSNIVCDFCNTGILPSETCYYIAVLNQVYCSSCYQRWKRCTTQRMRVLRRCTTIIHVRCLLRTE